MKNGLLIFSAPSGSGKSTIVNWLMKEAPGIEAGFLYQLYLSCSARYRTEWCRVFLPLSRGIQG